MHELSLVMNIIDLAEAEALRAQAAAINAIDLEIGLMSSVEPEAFAFAWEQGKKDTLLEHAALNIQYIAGKAHCLECGCEFPVEALYDNCPQCNSFLADIIHGKELRIKSITIP